MNDRSDVCSPLRPVLVLAFLLVLLINFVLPAAAGDQRSGFIYDPDDPFWQMLRSGTVGHNDEKPADLALNRSLDVAPTDLDRDWTILFYDDADFESAYDPLDDLTEDVFSNNAIDFLVLQDTNDGPAMLWHIEGDGQRTLLETLGEVDMGHYTTLRDFIQYGKANYPANRYMICLYDHGAAWVGACWDEGGEVATYLSMDDFQAAITEGGGIDIITFTAPCLMGAVESVYELRNCVDVYIGSEEFSGFALWEEVMDDMCLLLSHSDLLSNEQIGAEIIDLIAAYPHTWRDFTMSASSSAQVGTLAQRIGELADYLAADMMTHHLDIEQARDMTLDVWWDWCSTVDLWSAFTRMQEVFDDPFVDAKCTEILDAFDATIIAAWGDVEHPSDKGLSLHFPGDYSQYLDLYHSIGLDFTADTGWDEFLQIYLGGYQQPISGTVTDDVTGLPLDGVTVTDVSTGRQTTTATDGTYSLVVPLGDHELLFSSFYYTDVMIPVQVLYGTPAACPAALSWLPQLTIVGRVTDQDGTVLPDVRCTPSHPSLGPTITDAEGKFIFTGVPVDTEIDFTCDGLPFHGADFLRTTTAETGSAIWPLHCQLADATYTFQWWPEGFFLDGNWIHGRPTVGPGTAFSDTTCLGIGMVGEGFPADGTFYLTSPDNVNMFGHEELYLSFHYWCHLEDGVDGVKLQYKLLADNWSWFDIEPMNGYGRDSVAALDGDPGWSGYSDGWESAVFDLSDYTEKYILYRFVLKSDGADNGGFFLIDDVTLDTRDGVSPVPEQPSVPGVFAPRLAFRPNPFNPMTTVDWTIDRPGWLSLKVYDTRGRLVRTLYEGHTVVTRGETVFNGLDDRGRNLASGIYLVRAGDGRGRKTTTRISLIK